MEKRIHHHQLSLRTLLIVAMLGPPLVAGSYFFVRAVDAPFLAVVGSVVVIGFWTAILIRIVSGWFKRRRTRQVLQNSARPGAASCADF
jgi:hypothetical protein